MFWQKSTQAYKVSTRTDWSIAISFSVDTFMTAKEC